MSAAVAGDMLSGKWNKFSMLSQICQDGGVSYAIYVRMYMEKSVASQRWKGAC